MPLYTVQQVSALVGFHLKSVYRAIDQGRLEAVRIGTRTIRVSDRALTEWVSKGKATQKAIKEKRK